MPDDKNPPAKKVAPPETNSFGTVTGASTTSPAAMESLGSDAGGKPGTTAQGSQKDKEAGAAEMAEAAKRDAKDAAGDAKAAAKDTADAAKSRAQELKHEAEGMSDKARDMASEQADNAKRMAAEKVREGADTIRERGREYGEDSYQAYAADYLATNLSSAADVLRERDMGDLIDEATHFARRNPALFLGGATLLGFGLARLMKASASDLGPRRGRSDYVQPYDERRFDPPQSGIRNTPHGNKTVQEDGIGGYQR